MAQTPEQRREHDLAAVEACIRELERDGFTPSAYLLGERDRLRPADPLDVEYDGVKLRDLLSTGEAARREGPGACRTRHTPAQRAAVSAHWSAELRAKVAASKRA